MFCIICLDKISVAEIMTSCRHTYHKTCLDTWLKKSKECPVCRQKITYELMGPQTRSRTERIRAKRAMMRIRFLMDLFDISPSGTHKKKIIKKILKLACENRVILRKRTVFWGGLRYFGQDVISNDKDGYYDTLMQQWNIKFEQ